MFQDYNVSARLKSAHAQSAVQKEFAKQRNPLQGDFPTQPQQFVPCHPQMFGVNQVLPAPVPQMASPPLPNMSNLYQPNFIMVNPQQQARFKPEMMSPTPLSPPTMHPQMPMFPVFPQMQNGQPMMIPVVSPMIMPNGTPGYQQPIFFFNPADNANRSERLPTKTAKFFRSTSSCSNLSHDGSDISSTQDLGCANLSLRRSSSDKDGYGSDISGFDQRSRADFSFPDSDYESNNEQGEQIYDVDSPAQMINPSHLLASSQSSPDNQGSPNPNSLMNPFDGLCDSTKETTFQQHVREVLKKNAKSSECNVNKKTYTPNFLLGCQTKPQVQKSSPEFSRLSKQHGPPMVEQMSSAGINNLNHYLHQLKESKFVPMIPSGKFAKKRPTSKERQEEMYKTDLCNSWMNGRKCKFGKRCIFAHGHNELRQPKRVIHRPKIKLPLKKSVTSILNKLAENNQHCLTKEFLNACRHDIRSVKDCMLVVRTFFLKGTTEKQFQHLHVNLWRKLMNSHKYGRTMKKQMFEMCLSEYANPRSKEFALGSLAWVLEIAREQQDLVYKILDDMFINSSNAVNIELWCNLIKKARQSKVMIKSDRYVEKLTSMKNDFNKRLCFMIEDLRS